MTEVRPLVETAPAPEEPGRVFASARANVDGFVASTFSFSGTLRLHRAALGWDLLRAPANVALAPVHLAIRLLALVMTCVGGRSAARWLDARQVFLPTAVARRLETRIIGDLLGLNAGGRGFRADRAFATSPALREVLRATGSVKVADSRAATAARSVARYSGTRSAVAEITTAVVALFLGALLFRSVTPGALSMAPTIADALARETAVSSFPLGSTLGSAWYAAFPVGASTLEVVGTIAALLVVASCVTTFAGLVADPLQARLGIHRRRLLRLIDAMESDLTGAPPRPFAARGHYYARFADLLDGASAIFRILR